MSTRKREKSYLAERPGPSDSIIMTIYILLTMHALAAAPSGDLFYLDSAPTTTLNETSITITSSRDRKLDAQQRHGREIESEPGVPLRSLAPRRLSSLLRELRQSGHHEPGGARTAPQSPPLRMPTPPAIKPVLVAERRAPTSLGQETFKSQSMLAAFLICMLFAASLIGVYITISTIRSPFLRAFSSRIEEKMPLTMTALHIANVSLWLLILVLFIGFLHRAGRNAMYLSERSVSWRYSPRDFMGAAIAMCILDPSLFRLNSIFFFPGFGKVVYYSIGEVWLISRSYPPRLLALWGELAICRMLISPLDFSKSTSEHQIIVTQLDSITDVLFSFVSIALIWTLHRDQKDHHRTKSISQDLAF